jgi:hypothetical protein
MNNFIQKIKENQWWICLALITLSFFRQCGTSRDLDKLVKTQKAIQAQIDSINHSLVTKAELENQMNQSMFNFLIYEDDFDKGKASLSEIKTKIEKK